MGSGLVGGRAKNPRRKVSIPIGGCAMCPLGGMRAAKPRAMRSRAGGALIGGAFTAESRAKAAATRQAKSAERAAILAQMRPSFPSDYATLKAYREMHPRKAKAADAQSGTKKELAALRKKVRLYSKVSGLCPPYKNPELPNGLNSANKAYLEELIDAFHNGINFM